MEQATQKRQSTHGSSSSSKSRHANDAHQDEHESDQQINVGSKERVISATAGALLAFSGLRRRSVPGAIMMILGGMLIKRGVTGSCDVYRSLGIDTADEE